MAIPIGTIHGPINAEDLVRVPDTPWVITSGMLGPTVPQAHLYAIDVRDHSCTEIYPYGASADYDPEFYDADAGPLEARHFEPHGIDIGYDAGGRLCVFVVHHGMRESVEVFRLEIGDKPALTWIGALVVPHGVWGNDVACVGNGRLLLTSTTDISEGLEQGFGASLAGEETGKVVEWTPGHGWSDVAGSAMNSTNGVAASDGGDRVFVGGWVPRNVVRIDRSGPAPRVESVRLDIMSDNLTWADDGRLLVAGTGVSVAEFTGGFYSPEPICRFPTQVVAIDPNTLEAETLLAYGPDAFGVGTTATQVDNEIWVGSMRFEGIARFKL